MTVVELPLRDGVELSRPALGAGVDRKPAAGKELVPGARMAVRFGGRSVHRNPKGHTTSVAEWLTELQFQVHAIC